MATDNFNGTDGDPLSANWTETKGAFLVKNNGIGPSNASNNSFAFWNADTFASEHYAEATIVVLVTYSYIGLTVRGQTGSNGYGCYTNSATVFAIEVNSGSELTKHSKATIYSATDVMKVEANDAAASTTDVDIYNNDIKDTDLSFNDGTHSGGAPGLMGYFDSQDSQIDDWTGDDIGGGGGNGWLNRNFFWDNM